MLKCNIYNLNISQVICHTFYWRCFFVHDNLVCQKCFDLVFRSNQKLRKILKCLAWKRNGNCCRYCHTGEYLYILSHVASIMSSSEDHQLSLKAVLLLKSMDATLFESKIDAAGVKRD